MPADQTTIFAESEGDRWYQRNRAALLSCDARRDLPLQLVEIHGLRPAKVLEIGASNGCRLAAIAERCEARVTAVEPSDQAIRAGREAFTQIEFVQATADAIPLEAPFDLVIVNFVLHWVDRTRLLRSAAEIDRLLADGGFLIIGDFLPDRPTRVPYHHLPEQKVFTYKQNYAELFLASGLYELVDMLSGAHSGPKPAGEASADERIGAWLLHKGLQDYYQTKSLGSAQDNGK